MFSRDLFDGESLYAFALFLQLRHLILNYDRVSPVCTTAELISLFLSDKQIIIICNVENFNQVTTYINKSFALSRLF